MMKEINEMEPNFSDLMLNIRVSNDVTTVNKMVKIASTTTDRYNKKTYHHNTNSCTKLLPIM